MTKTTNSMNIAMVQSPWSSNEFSVISFSRNDKADKTQNFKNDMSVIKSKMLE